MPAIDVRALVILRNRFRPGAGQFEALGYCGFAAGTGRPFGESLLAPTPRTNAFHRAASIAEAAGVPAQVFGPCCPRRSCSIRSRGRARRWLRECRRLRERRASSATGTTSRGPQAIPKLAAITPSRATSLIVLQRVSTARLVHDAIHLETDRHLDALPLGDQSNRRAAVAPSTTVR